MNREDIIRMAREAGILESIDLLESNPWRQDTIRELERFADLVISHKLDEIADKLTQDFKQSFGADTCASWAAWLRSQK